MENQYFHLIIICLLLCSQILKKLLLELRSLKKKNDIFERIFNKQGNEFLAFFGYYSPIFYKWLNNKKIKLGKKSYYDHQTNKEYYILEHSKISNKWKLNKLNK
jgi:hypothetical protein